MAQIIGMPKLGFDMAEGTLIRWVIQEGEQVTKGAVLAEIETDKATVEVQSEYDGVLLRQIVPQGTVVPINDPIAVIGEAGESVDVEAMVGKPASGEKPTPLERPLEQATPVQSAAGTGSRAGHSNTCRYPERGPCISTGTLDGGGIGSGLAHGPWDRTRWPDH